MPGIRMPLENCQSRFPRIKTTRVSQFRERRGVWGGEGIEGGGGGGEEENERKNGEPASAGKMRRSRCQKEIVPPSFIWLRGGTL